MNFKILYNLGRLFRLSPLINLWIFAQVLKYQLGGLRAFELGFNGENNFFTPLTHYWHIIGGWKILLLLYLCSMLDRFLWPYFWREEFKKIRTIIRN